MNQEIPNVETASYQEIFDYVVTNLLKQGSKSASEEHPDECVYRGPGGKKCAAGFLIPDERYSKDLEGQNVFYVIEAIIPNFNSSIESHYQKRELIGDLQLIHDEWEIEDWKRGFAELAKMRKLAINFS